MPVRINGATSGSTTIAAPDTGGDETIVLSTALASKANLASPTFTGTPAAPTAAAGTNTTQIATTAFVQANGGLTLITSQSFNTVSTVSVNSCFSGTYDVYEIVIRLTQQSGDGTLFVRLRTDAGSDISTTTYENANQAITTGGSEIGDSQTGATAMRICETDSGTTDDRYLIFIQMAAPFLAANTVALSRSAYVTGGGSFASRHGAHLNTNNTAYPSFSIIAESGTISGSVSVYGYRK